MFFYKAARILLNLGLYFSDLVLLCFWINSTFLMLDFVSYNIYDAVILTGIGMLVLRGIK